MKKKILLLLAILSFWVAIPNAKAIYLKIQQTSINETMIQRDGEVLHLKHYQSEKDDIIYNYVSTILSIPTYEELSYFTQNGNFILNLPEEEWNRVELLAYYGYGYQNHTESKWYEITQYLIWNTLEPDYTWSITDALNSSNHYEAEIEELNALVKRHLTFPSFAKDFIVLKEGEENVFIDENNVLQDYILDNLGSFDLNAKENELILQESENDEMDFDNIIFIHKHGTTGHYTKIYINPRYKLIGRGDFTDVEKEIPIYIGGGNIILNDGDENSTYAILNEKGDIVDYIKVGETSRLLPYGSYQIKASNLPSDIKDPNVYEVTLGKESGNVSITTKQEKQEEIIPTSPKEDLLPEEPKEEIKPENPKEEIKSDNTVNDNILSDIKNNINEGNLSFVENTEHKKEDIIPSVIGNQNKPVVVKQPEMIPIPNQGETSLTESNKQDIENVVEETDKVSEDTAMKEVLNQQPAVLENKMEKKDNHYLLPILYSLLAISVFSLILILKNYKEEK